VAVRAKAPVQFRSMLPKKTPLASNECNQYWIRERLCYQRLQFDVTFVGVKEKIKPVSKQRE
jgi:hypothetical protein